MAVHSNFLNMNVVELLKTVSSTFKVVPRTCFDLFGLSSGVTYYIHTIIKLHRIYMSFLQFLVILIKLSLVKLTMC
jgi:hypothetical protein